MLMFRPPSFRSGGGGIGRPRVGGIKQADQNITCSSSEDDREFVALDTLKLVRSQSIWLVRYAPGNFQMWWLRRQTSRTRGSSRMAAA